MKIIWLYYIRRQKQLFQERSGCYLHAYEIYHRLTRYHLDGRYRINNNMAENSIRPLALGRKNYLFCGNNDAAEDAAVIYSLLVCCKAVSVNPHCRYYGAKYL